MATAKKPALKVVSDNTKAEATVTAKPVKIPGVRLGTTLKDLAAAADALYTIRQNRLALDKQVEELKKQETKLREHLINNVPKSNATGVAGKIVRATIENKTVIQVASWDQVHAYILKNAKKNPGVFGLFQRRINETMVKEMLENGVTVPGTDTLDVPTVSLNKV